MKCFQPVFIIPELVETFIYLRFFHQGTGKRIIENRKINLFAFCQSSYLQPTLIEDQNDLDKFALEIHNICLLDRIELSLL